MRGSELVAEVRRRLRDAADPPLWEDAEILTYLSLAERELCERTHVLVDYDCYQVQTTAGVGKYELDPEVLSIPVAQLSSATAPLGKVHNLEAMAFATTSGQPTHAGVIGSSPSYLSLYPVPDAVYTVLIAAAIAPSAALTLGSSPKVAASLHMGLTYGAIVECLHHSDVDGFEPELLDRYEAKWGTLLRDTKREVYRQAFSPNAMANIPSWTGGRA